MASSSGKLISLLKNIEFSSVLRQLFLIGCKMYNRLASVHEKTRRIMAVSVALLYNISDANIHLPTLARQHKSGAAMMTAPPLINLSCRLGPHIPFPPLFP